MEKVEIRKIIEDMIITQFLHSEMDMIHEEDVSFEELGLDSIDKVELDVMVEQKFNIVIIDYYTESIKEMTKNKYNGPRLHLGLIEEIKAAFIDFLPAGTVLY